MAKKEKAPKEKKQNQEKKQKEPQYYSSADNIPTYNYKVYHMKKMERVLTFLVGLIGGAAVGYLFYGGIGKDEFGNPTTLTWILDIAISGAFGIATGIAAIPIRTKMIVDKQIRTIKSQFRDMLEALATNLGSGKNVPQSFESIYKDMQVQYDEGAYILDELHIINSGIDNNIAVEDILTDFGKRSGSEDIVDFANVFKIAYRRGGNLKETIRNTHTILSDKMEIAEDIETVVTANKNEQNLMLIMPILLIAMIKSISPDFAANFTTVAGIGATTLAVFIFIASYFIGKAVLNIKV